MNRFFAIAIAAALSLLFVQSVHAQAKRLSPHETLSAVVDNNRVTIVYGRPYSTKPGTTEVRKVWGTLVPWGKVWRAGADEATLLISQKPLVIGGAPVAAGAYTLFMLPNEDGTAKLIISKQLGQWGLQYDEKQDLVRVDMKKDSMDKTVDQFTMSVGKDSTAAAGVGVLKMMWENATYSVQYSVAK